MSGAVGEQDVAPPVIHTYHCLCSNLLFATTHLISSLPRRGTAGLDGAYILPCPPLPRPKETKLEYSSASEDSDEAEDEAEEGGDEEEAGNREVREEHDDGSTLTVEKHGYTVLVSLGVPPREPPMLVRRSDGFEKRWVLKCGRCKLAVAYQLDWSQFQYGQDATAVSGARVPGLQDEKKGRREDILYLLPGGIMTTSEMKAGRKFTEEEMGFGIPS